MKNLIFPLFLLVIFISTSCKPAAKVPSEDPAAKREMEELRRQIQRLNTDLAEKESANAQLMNEKQMLEKQLQSTRNSLQDVTAQMQESSDDFGIWFRVQIGAYENTKIDKSLETTDNLSLEDRDDLQKIVLGRFRNYNDAKNLQQSLKQIGLADAWIVSYRDGKRISIEEALKN